MTWDGGEPSIGPVYSPKMIDVFGPARVPRSELEHAARRSGGVGAGSCSRSATSRCSTTSTQRTGLKKVCLAGGVALNCVANGMIFERTPFEDVYIQPAAHDAGTSIGAALHVWHQVLKQPRGFVMRHVYYGPEYSDADIRARARELAVVEYQPARRRAS